MHSVVEAYENITHKERHAVLPLRHDMICGVIPQMLYGTIRNQLSIEIYVSNTEEHILIVIFRPSIVPETQQS